MGTDGAPGSEIEGAIRFLEMSGSDREVLLVGHEDLIGEGLQAFQGYPSHRLSVVHAPDRIVPGEAPVAAVRRKPRSSIVVGVRSSRRRARPMPSSAPAPPGAVMAASLLSSGPLRSGSAGHRHHSPHVRSPCAAAGRRGERGLQAPAPPPVRAPRAGSTLRTSWAWQTPASGSSTSGRSRRRGTSSRWSPTGSWPPAT
jgi:hypothetical protein